jgi:uncharacterized protein YggE
MKYLAVAAALLACAVAHADTLQTNGALVVVPAFGEVKHVNDQAIATLSVEEIDKDKAVAASRVNQKMKQGLEILKKADPQASLKTQGYYTYPVYPEEAPQVPGQVQQPRKPRVPTSWRVGQSVQVVTSNLEALPKTVAAAQSVLGLNNLRFGLTPETTRQLEDQRIAATYQNLNERISAIAKAMGRKLSDAVLDTADFEGSGNYANRVEVSGSRVMAYASNVAPAAPPPVTEPSFEPGETVLSMRLVGKVRFK